MSLAQNCQYVFGQVWFSLRVIANLVGQPFSVFSLSACVTPQIFQVDRVHNTIGS